MRNHTKLILAAAIAALALSLGGGAASASRSIRLNGVEAGGAMRWNGQATFHRTGEARDSIICDITLLRTITRTIPKTAGTLIGKVTGVAVDRGARGEHCRGTGIIGGPIDIIPLIGTGRSGLHRELGGGILLWTVTGGAAELWKLIYDGFSGTLPTITAIRFHIQKAQFNFEFRTLFQLTCEVEGSLRLSITFGVREEEAGRGEGEAESRLETRTRNCEIVNPLTMRGTFVITPAISRTLL